jgi:hypothetical protein
MEVVVNYLQPKYKQSDFSYRVSLKENPIECKL